MPAKNTAITLISWWHRLIDSTRAKYIARGQQPDLALISREYASCLAALPKHLKEGAGGTKYLDLNPDHQALRNGSLVWSCTSQEQLDGIENFISWEGFLRGYGSPYTAPPAMGMSVAFAISSALERGLIPSPLLRARFLAVCELKRQNNWTEENTSIAMRLQSVAFDAVYAVSLASTAYRLSGEKKWLWEIRDVLLSRGYAYLMLAPMTYFTQEHRNYFIDHLHMVGLWTIVKSGPSWWTRLLARLAMRWVYAHSAHLANPYFAALAHQCGVLSERQRKKILDVHAFCSPLRAATYRSVVYTDMHPSDYSTHSADEFLFDEIHGHGLSNDQNVLGMVPLNGLCLGMSIAVLMEEEKHVYIQSGSEADQRSEQSPER
jgi:hypothetical protein